MSTKGSFTLEVITFLFSPVFHGVQGFWIATHSSCPTVGCAPPERNWIGGNRLTPLFKAKHHPLSDHSEWAFVQVLIKLVSVASQTRNLAERSLTQANALVSSSGLALSCWLLPSRQPISGIALLLLSTLFGGQPGCSTWFMGPLTLVNTHTHPFQLDNEIYAQVC